MIKRDNLAVISLLTDFGLHDEYVGVMKGVILSVNPSATIVDVTHGVEPRDVMQAAYLMEAAWRYFPAGTVHVVVVDPGVGSQRAILALRRNGHLFLAPDNGVLTPILESEAVEGIFRVENERHFLHPVSGTFHGRDVFAPVAAHLTLGAALSSLGPPADRDRLVRLPLQTPTLSGAGEILGAVVSVDRFGNLITNIDIDRLQRWRGRAPNSGLRIRLGNHQIRGLSSCYSSVAPGEALAVFGSRGCLEIAVNAGSAAERFNSRPGDAVRVSGIPGES